MKDSSQPGDRCAPSGDRNCRAFTLTELMAVITAVGLLAALLLPAIGATHQRDKSAVCMSNLRQIGVGMAMFAAENDDALYYNGGAPSSSVSIPNAGQWTITPNSQDILRPNDPRAYWGVAYYRHAGSSRETFRCPSARTVDEWRESGLPFPTEYWLTSSYGINRYLVESHPLPSQSPRKISGFVNPTTMIIAQDSAEQKMEGADDSLGLFPGQAGILAQWRFGLAGFYPGLRMESEWYRHDNRCNTLWLSGNVSRIPFNNYAGIDYRHYTGETPLAPVPSSE